MALQGNSVHNPSAQHPSPHPFALSSSRSALLSSAHTLPAIRSQKDKHLQNQLLIRKLSLCCHRCDFRLAQQDGDRDEAALISIKSSMLHEIKGHLETGSDWHSVEVVAAIFRFVASNLFRSVPDSFLTEHLMGVDHHVPITHSLPSWQHLSVVYDVLHLALSNGHIPSPLLTEHIAKHRLLDHFVALLDSADKRERLHVQSVLETVWMDHGDVFEEPLRAKLVAYCLEFIHFGAGSAEAIKSILNVLNSMSVIDADLFVTVLLPLHRLEYGHFRHYEFVLWIYCKRIMEEDESLALLLIKCLLRYWPRRSALKEQQFLKKMALILDFVEEDLWRDVDRQTQPRQHALFEAMARKLAHSLQHCNHYKTICDILDILELEEVQEFVEKYGGQQLWCRIYQALHDIARHFFYKETTLKTKETMEVLREQDEVPMAHVATFRRIECGQLRMYPLQHTAFGVVHSPQQLRARSLRKRKYDALRQRADRRQQCRNIQPRDRWQLRPQGQDDGGLQQKRGHHPQTAPPLSSGTRPHFDGLSQRRDRHHQSARRDRAAVKAESTVNPRAAASTVNAKPFAKPVVSRSVPLQSHFTARPKRARPPSSLTPTSTAVNAATSLNASNGIPPPPPPLESAHSPPSSPYYARYVENRKVHGDGGHRAPRGRLQHSNSSRRVRAVRSTTSKAPTPKPAVSRSTSYKIIPKKRAPPHFSKSLPAAPPPEAIAKSASAGTPGSGPERVGKISINSGDIVHSKKRSFWPSSRRHRPQLSQTDSDKENQQRIKRERQREKALEKAERLRVRERERAQKLKAKRDKKELKQRMKEMKRAQKGRIRKSVDIDRRSSSIDNPLPPRQDTVHYETFSQIVQNNTSNQYLNAQYYEDEHPRIDIKPVSVVRSHRDRRERPRQPPRDHGGHRKCHRNGTRKQDRDRSPKLQFSYSPLSTFDAPTVCREQPVFNEKAVRNGVGYGYRKRMNGRKRPPPKRHLPPNPHRKSSSDQLGSTLETQKSKAAKVVHHKTSNSDTLWTRKPPPNRKLPSKLPTYSLAKATPLSCDHPFRVK